MSVKADEDHPDFKRAHAHLRRETKSPFPSCRIRPTYRSVPIRISTSLRRMDHRFQLIPLNQNNKSSICGLSLYVRFEYTELDSLHSCIVKCEPIFSPSPSTTINRESATALPGNNNESKQTIFKNRLLFGYFNDHVIEYYSEPWKLLRDTLGFESMAVSHPFLRSLLSWSLGPEVTNLPFDQMVDAVERPYDRHAVFLSAINSFEIAAGAATTGRVLLGRDVCVLVLEYIGPVLSDKKESSWDIPEPAHLKFDREREHCRRLSPVLNSQPTKIHCKLPRLEAIFLAHNEVVLASGLTCVDHRFQLHRLDRIVGDDNYNDDEHHNVVEMHVSFQFHTIYANYVLDNFTIAMTRQYGPTVPHSFIAFDAVHTETNVLFEYSGKKQRCLLYGGYAWHNMRSGLGLSPADDMDALMSALFYWVTMPYCTGTIDLPRSFFQLNNFELQAINMADIFDRVTEGPPNDYSIQPTNFDNYSVP